MDFNQEDAQDILNQLRDLFQSDPADRKRMIAEMAIKDNRTAAGMLLAELETCETDAEKIDKIALFLLKTCNTAHVGFASLAVSNYRKIGAAVVPLRFIEDTMEHFETAISILDPTLEKDLVKMEEDRNKRRKHADLSVYGEPDEDEEENDESEEGVKPDDEAFEGFKMYAQMGGAND